MKLWAIGDLHVNRPANREAVADLEARPGDWLILAGDVADRIEDVEWALDVLGSRFARLLWVPGNHELWTVPRESERGVARYRRLVEACRERGVLTPEDPWPRWPGEGPPTVIAPCFLLYDYSFAPQGVEDPVAWAAEQGIRAVDERLLHFDPHPSREAWCAERLRITEERLRQVPEGHRIVLINHWPLRRDLVRIYAVPRYVPWCGTRATEDWHRRFPIHVAVHGHLHMRATDWRDGVRFEEVALGYPRHWRQGRGAGAYLREILPGRLRQPPAGGWGGPVWHR